MPDLLETLKSLAPYRDLITLGFVVFGIQLAFWKADKDRSKMIHHTVSEHSAPFQEVVLTEIMMATNKTQKLMLVLIGVITISILMRF
jgi:hypothetical protein